MRAQLDPQPSFSSCSRSSSSALAPSSSNSAARESDSAPARRTTPRAAARSTPAVAHCSRAARPPHRKGRRPPPPHGSTPAPLRAPATGTPPTQLPACGVLPCPRPPAVVPALLAGCCGIARGRCALTRSGCASSRTPAAAGAARGDRAGGKRPPAARAPPPARAEHLQCRTWSCGCLCPRRPADRGGSHGRAPAPICIAGPGAVFAVRAPGQPPQPPRLLAPAGAKRRSGGGGERAAVLGLSVPGAAAGGQPPARVSEPGLGEHLPRVVPLRFDLHLHLRAQRHPQLPAPRLRAQRGAGAHRPHLRLRRGARPAGPPRLAPLGPALLPEGAGAGAPVLRRPALPLPPGAPGLARVGARGLSARARNRAAARAVSAARPRAVRARELARGVRAGRPGARRRRLRLQRRAGPARLERQGYRSGDDRRRPGGRGPHHQAAGRHAAAGPEPHLRAVPLRQHAGAARCAHAPGRPRAGARRHRLGQLLLAHRPAAGPPHGHRPADRRLGPLSGRARPAAGGLGDELDHHQDAGCALAHRGAPQGQRGDRDRRRVLGDHEQGRPGAGGPARHHPGAGAGAVPCDPEGRALRRRLRQGLYRPAVAGAAGYPGAAARLRARARQLRPCAGRAWPRAPGGAGPAGPAGGPACAGGARAPARAVRGLGRGRRAAGRRRARRAGSALARPRGRSGARGHLPGPPRHGRGGSSAARCSI
ncbi:MAG: hypothetical protein KatS3mg102_2649 [Planctomycetota bacterium]|nr:MAG: hypothetical protein KatS3mg102_2649 [Planctomycetota bacterium]